MQKFLTAKWHNLVMANYVVEPELLQNRVPKGTTLDFHEGKLFVSLVGFMFLETKVLGIPIPFHINFEEVNLRFYVKRETKDEIRRGVCFVKEIVPRFAITTVARTIYGEPYETWKMSHAEQEKELTYVWEKDNIKNCLHVEVSESLGVPATGSEGEFIIEHYWGYTKRKGNRTDEYKVEHPKWELFKVNYAEIDVDFGKTYGKEFAFLSDLEPASILLAKGSEIAVYKGEKLR
ncbi:MAG TPA: DUF2071 domain-containing protein [Pyrinomonadaceae bacterium]|nr:DUF2071 domain-containing protein [Pyrinomonadaceae bacterium]